MKLNEKIAWYRREKKLSQEELAARVGVSRQAVSKWELGEAAPDINKLLALARAFGVTTDHLLDEGAEPERPASPPPAQEPSAPPPPPQAAPGSGLPGFVGRMVRRWGWLAGIYLALEGAGLTLFGFVGRFMFSSFFQSIGSMGGMGFGGAPFGGFPGDYVIYNESGQVIQSGSSGLSGIQSAMLAIPTLALIIGLIMVIGGLILAYVLWKNGKKGG